MTGYTDLMISTTDLDSLRNDDGSLATHAWPGGYPLFYEDREASVLCPLCASIEDDEDDSSYPVYAEINYEDPALYCDQCGARIPSAYAEDNTVGSTNNR